MAKATAEKSVPMTAEESLAKYESARAKLEAEWNRKSAELAARPRGKNVDVPLDELKPLADEYKAKTEPLWKAHVARMAGEEFVEEEVTEASTEAASTPDGTENAKAAIEAFDGVK